MMMMMMMMTITGHLVLELVKLPPPRGEEERPEKSETKDAESQYDLLGINLALVMIVMMMMTMTKLDPHSGRKGKVAGKSGSIKAEDKADGRSSTRGPQRLYSAEIRKGGIDGLGHISSLMGLTYLIS